ncbi:MAG: tRNA uridine(34) 5-carboxymethylaminomethyl modification radical SAM/GNAT enzyme Elp3 [DPANN group archaeon]|nr:tRNA uridine(34) 5-carboxymethylaminomethyl modification radical SAM/GNAT enzyme Elp3 [DPANN group archaeon]
MTDVIDEQFVADLLARIRGKNPAKDDISRIKNRLAAKHHLRKAPTDIDILLRASAKERRLLKPYLKTKPVRTQSGVAPVALMTRPINCKHGRCTYCPGGIGSFFGDMPQSYTGNEPSTMRAIRNDYEAYLIAMNRLEQYALLGHELTKVEAIVMGGTFTSFDRRYQRHYITDMFQAFNDFGDRFMDKGRVDLDKLKEAFLLPGDLHDKGRAKKVKKNLHALKRKTTLEKEQQRNESATVRCVALCLETRPDYAKPRHIDQMLRLGCTRVEMGVQSVHDEVLRAVHRSHTVKESIDATRYLKDSLLKVGYHMMLGLPGMDYDQDLEQLRQVITDSRFKPDALKIYPTMVMPGTVLHTQYRRGEYTPMRTKEAASLIAKFMKDIPSWLRIMRVQRDIPTKVTIDGVDRTNLRQYVEQEMQRQGIRSRDIRAREPKHPQDPKDWMLVRQEYEASKGTEIFLSMDNRRHDELLGFLRLRIPSRPMRKEFDDRTAGIRELHVYGGATALGKKGEVQHRGIGRRLLEEAERIAKEEFKKDMMLIISGVGAREYYRKFGYRRTGPYMRKGL